MLQGKRIITYFGIVFFVSAVAFCEGLEDDWNDFLHYTTIGRIDLAKGFAEKIVNSQPDPLELLGLSEENTKGYSVLLSMHANSEELREVSGALLEIIEQGRYIRRTDPKIIVAEIKRLSGTIRGRLAAEERLKNAGEYAVPYMLGALSDESRKESFSDVARALPKIGRDAIRPLVAALQTDNVAVKAEVIRALGQVGYRQGLGYLKYVMEKDESARLRSLAEDSIKQIDESALKLSAAELLYQLAENYYYHAESVAPAEDYDFANVWFWDEGTDKLSRQEVDKAYFNELMAMRVCEWGLKADPVMGKVIALWLASFFKAESAGIPMPEYFGQGHADAMTYATTSGPEYLQQALERALNEPNAYVALGVVEALAANAGEKSLLYQLGTEQPLIKALSFDDTPVRYSAAIAIGKAGPTSDFVGSKLIVENLAAAIAEDGSSSLGAELADSYAVRAAETMLKLAVESNDVVDLSIALDTLVKSTKDSRPIIQILAGKILARLESSEAQRAIAVMALANGNAQQVRIEAFKALAVSAKLDGNLLTEEQIDSLYTLISSDETEPDLRGAAAGAYGALNLPSRRVKELILSQARS